MVLPDLDEAAAILLCGGGSRRMGRPKAMLEIAGTPMIGYVTTALLAVVDEVIVVSAPGEPLPDCLHDPRVRLVHDDILGAGPLAGMAVGLESLSPSKRFAYVSACDVPRLSESWVRGMISSLRPEADIVVPLVTGKLHPLAGVYRRSVAATARKLLHQGDHRVNLLTGLHPTICVRETQLRKFDARLAALQNINTPADFERLWIEWNHASGMETFGDDS